MDHSIIDQATVKPYLLTIPQEIHDNISERLIEVIHDLSRSHHVPRLGQVLTNLRSSHSVLNRAYGGMHLKKVKIVGTPRMFVEKIHEFIQATTIHHHVETLALRVIGRSIDSNGWENHTKTAPHCKESIPQDLVPKLVLALQKVSTARRGRPFNLNIDIQFLPVDTLNQLWKALADSTLLVSGLKVHCQESADFSKSILEACSGGHLRQFSMVTTGAASVTIDPLYDTGKRLAFDAASLGKLHPTLSSFSYSFVPGPCTDMPYLTERFLKDLSVALPWLRHLSIYGRMQCCDDQVSWIRQYFPHVSKLSTAYFDQTHSDHVHEARAAAMIDDEHLSRLDLHRGARELALRHLEENETLDYVRVLDQAARLKCGWVGIRGKNGVVSLKHICNDAKWCLCEFRKSSRKLRHSAAVL